MIAWPGLVALGVSNAVPLVGVLAFGWDLSSILVMYWIEAGVVGLANVLKIHRSMALGALADGDRPIERQRSDPRLSGGWLLAGIWLLCYGFFWAILGLFVAQIASGGFYEGASQTGWSLASADQIVTGTLVLIAGQLAIYVLDYVLGRRYLTVTPVELLRDPFVRLFVILATIAVGGVGIALAGSPVGFLAAMVVAKTAVEIWFAHSAPAPAV
jgi:hypothetical protein